MPIYDLVCTTCGYEKGETIFPTWGAFQNAEKERECPNCYHRLDAKLSCFNVCKGRKYKTTGGKICEKNPALVLEIGATPCGHIGLRRVSLAEILKVQHDPENN